ncbi:MAG: hypothetical protein CMH27_05210 [Micavibrio sp.]|nr:hypothetical protein [Micavibrio sp.]|tara:strand:- start:691 stop:1044 length:354 start_codon:yes stop_codon:yes gene_type:complete
MSTGQMQDGAGSIEYSVYVYFDPKKAKSKSPWEMKGITDNMDKAIAEAEKYYNTREFQKVEVKKKYFDVKNSRTIDMTLKTFEGNLKKEMGAYAILGIGVAISAAAFIAAYLVTSGL